MQIYKQQYAAVSGESNLKGIDCSVQAVRCNKSAIQCNSNLK